MSNVSAVRNFNTGISRTDSFDNKEITFDILSSGKVPVKQQFVIEYSKDEYELIKDEDKRYSRYVVFAQNWKIQEIAAQVEKFQRSIFPFLLAIIFDDEEIEEFLQPNQSPNNLFENILECLASFSVNRPFIIQKTSKYRNETKLFYKDENSPQFQCFDVYKKKPMNVKNFKDLFCIFMNEKIDNFEEKIVKAFPNVNNLNVIWDFLKTLELPEEFFNKIIIKCAEEGTKSQLLTVINATNDSGIMIMDGNVMNNMSRVFKLDSSLEQSILSAAVKKQNMEILIYIIQEFYHIFHELPFKHQLNISTVTHEFQNFEFLCDLLELCDFPFPKNFYPAIINNERLKYIIKNRQEFHKVVALADIGKIESMIEKFPSHKFIYNETNNSALYQAAKVKNFSIYHHLKTTYGLKMLKEEERIMKKITVHAYKLITTDANVKSAIFSDEKFTAALISKSSIHSSLTNKQNYRLYHEKIKKWYEQISKIKFGSALLKVVSSCNKLKIVFDFEHEHTSQLDYIYSNEQCIGIFLPDYHWIFIGAKDSNDNKRDRIIRGTIAHEFCHYAIHLVFKNFVKPYYNTKNKEKEQLYRTIIQDIHRWLLNQPKDSNDTLIDNCENIILYAFTSYSNTNNELITQQELIVRVVEMLAYFYGDEDKISQLELTFANLFDFYKNHVNTEFESFDFEKQHIVSEFNEKTGILRELKKLMHIEMTKEHIKLSSNKDLDTVISNKITIVRTNILKLFLFDIYNNIHIKGPDMFNTENIVVCYEMLHKKEGKCDRNKLLQEFYDVLVKTPKLNVFISCSKITEFKTNWHAYNKTANYIYIVDNEVEYGKLVSNSWFNSASKVEINYKWEDLSAETQNLLLKTEITFDSNERLNLDSLLKNRNEDHHENSFVINDNLLKMLIEKTPIAINIFKIRKSGNFELLNQTRSFIRNFKDRKNANKTLTIDMLLAETENIKYILISDIAGAGKTWALLSIRIRIREKYSSRWTTYVDLKKFTEVFKKKSKMNFKEIGRELIFQEFFINHIISTMTDIEKDIFRHMYKIGKVSILFDGFDEIAPNYTEFILALIESFEHNRGNQMWITTRDHFDVDLQNRLKLIVSYKLSEITQKEGIDLMSEMWALNDMIKKGYKLSSRNQFLKKYNEICKNTSNMHRNNARDLARRSPGLAQRSVGLISIYKTLAEIGKDDMNSVDTYTEFKIYSKLAEKHYTVWTDYKGQLRKDANEKAQKNRINFYAVHEYEALKLLAPEFSHLCDIDYDEDTWTTEDSIGCGLMYVRDGQLYFIHRTFAEYFVADFIVRKLKKRKPFLERVNKEVLIFIAEVIEKKEFKVVRMFLDGALTEKKIMEKIKSVKNNSKVIDNISKITEKLDMVDLILGKYFNQNKLHNLAELLNLGLRKENYKTVKTTLLNTVQNKIQKMVSSNNITEDCGSEVAELFTKDAESFSDVEVFNHLMSNIIEKYGIEFTKQTLQQKFEITDDFINFLPLFHTRSHKVNIIQALSIGIRCSVDKFLEYIEILRKIYTNTEIIDMMKETDKHGNNIFHKNISNQKKKQQLILMWEKFESFFKSCDSHQIFRDFVLQANSFDQSILQYAVYDCDRVDTHETLWMLLLKTFEDHLDELWNQIEHTNFAHDLFEHCKPDIIDLTLKVIKDNFKTDKLLYLLEKRDKFQRNVIHYAACESPSENLECLINELIELTVHEDVKSSFSSLGPDNKNLLQSAAFWNKSLSVHKFLWNCFRKYFNSEEILSFIKYCDANGSNLLQIAVKCNSNEVVDFILSQVEDFMDENELDEYQKIKDDKC